MIVAFRRHTLLPLDDCLYALQPSLPHLTRSALHLASGKTILLIFSGTGSLACRMSRATSLSARSSSSIPSASFISI
jgi:hypothetical protein